MMPFITKYLGAVNYGIWSQVMVIVALLSPLVFCGMDNSLARFLPGKTREQQQQDFTGWFLFGLASSFFLFFLVFIFSHQFSELFFGTEGHYPAFVVLAGLNIMITSLLTGIRNWFRVQNNALSLVYITIIQNLTQMIVLIWILMTHQGIYELVLWSLIADSVLIGSYILYMFKTKIFSKPSLKWFKPYFRFGIVLLPSGYAVWVLNSLDRVFLAQYHSLADIGIYSIGFTIGYTLIQVIVNPIWSLFPTKSAELYNLNNITELNKLFNQSIKLICWLIFPSVFGLVIIGNQLLHFLSTEEFASGYLVVPIILSGYLFSMLSSYFEMILALKNKPYFSTIFTTLSCFINIILNFLLIPKFSYMGAALATTLSFCFQLTISSIYGLKENLISFEKTPILKILLSTLGMFLGTFYAKIYWFSFDENWSFFLSIFTGISIYLIFTWILQIYSFNFLLKLLKKDILHA